MAYITTEQVKERRNELKKQFPSKDGWKFSVTRLHHSKLKVVILNAPIDLMEDNDSGRSYYNVNEYYLDAKHYPNHHKVLKQISEIANAGHWDESNAMTDYFNCAWYFDLCVGSFDKEFIYKLKN